jgi:peptidoglycan/LPS O-acetylase OafA/YrhL
MSTVQDSRASRIVFLDYLRIFAFSSVIIGHRFYDPLVAYTQDHSAQPLLKLLISLLLPLFYCGAAGVVVFFFVSGYIITHVLQKENTREFLIKRFFRIYPLYVFAVLIQNSRSLMLCILYHQLIPERLPILLSQLSLAGDVFGTRYSLYGIEWTLRIEVLFYLYMALLHALRILHDFRKAFPYILILTTLLLGWLPAFPTWNDTNIGSVNIYAPFLLLGSMFYLAESRQASYLLLLTFSALVFFQYQNMISLLQPRWLGYHFALLAFILFSVSWLFRRHIKAGRFILLLSDLTYAAYLFHSWHYKYIRDMLVQNSFSLMSPDIPTLVLYIAVCILAVKYVEKPGIRLGQRLVKRLATPREKSL